MKVCDLTYQGVLDADKVDAFCFELRGYVELHRPNTHDNNTAPSHTNAKPPRRAARDDKRAPKHTNLERQRRTRHHDNTVPSHTDVMLQGAHADNTAASSRTKTATGHTNVIAPLGVGWDLQAGKGFIVMPLTGPCLHDM